MIYLDHNATTIPVPGLSSVVSPYLSSSFGNPSSSNYLAGREAKEAIEKSREQLASLVDCSPEEIIFTSGGTEAIYLSFLGLLDRLKEPTAADFTNKIAISRVEHSAVQDAAKYIASLTSGGLASTEITNLEINSDLSIGSLTLDQQKGIKIVASMLANNETGIFHDPSAFLNSLDTINSDYEFLSDPVQTIGKTNFSFSKSRASISFLSAHKFGGPKGIGALLVKKNSKWKPSFVGGGQEQGRRGGTESVPLIVGLGHAAVNAKKSLADGYEEEIKILRDKFEETLLSEIKNIEIVGQGKKRLPNTSCFLTSGVIGGEVSKAISLKDICISSGSACSSGSINPSKVLVALGYSTTKAISALRVSFGHGNTLEEIPIVVKELKNIVSEMRLKNESKLSKLMS